MNDPTNDLDPALEALFRREHTHVAEQPFVAATLTLVAAERGRAAFARRALQAAALIVVIAASPWLIDGSALLSSSLDSLFARASAWLATPGGVAAAAVAAVAVVAVRARWRRAGR